MTEVKNFVWLDAADGIIMEDAFESLEVKDEDEVERLHAYIDGPFRAMTRCPDCRRTLLVNHIDRDHGDNNKTDLKLFVCQNCGYWHYYEYGRVDSHPLAHRHTCAASHLCDFTDRLPEGPAVELAQFIRQNPDRWHELGVSEMEKLVADILKANHENSEAIHVGGSGDGGKDVIFIDDNKRKWLVSCKRRESADGTEDIETLRSLLGVSVLHRTKLGIIASTKNRFATGLHRERKLAKEVGYQIELLDRGLLTRMLGAVLDPRPWLKFVDYFSPDETEYFERIEPVEYGTYRIKPASRTQSKPLRRARTVARLRRK